MEKEKKSKKKVLLYYLILAACLLVIAAVTVTLVLTVGQKDPSDIIDNKPGVTNPDDDNKPGDNNDPNKDPDDGNKDPNKDPDNKPTGTTGVFGLPMQSAPVSAGYEFRYDVTLDRYCVHQGMDFEAAAGTQVCAVLEGTVAEIVTDHIIGENYVKINHTNGMTSTYKYIDAKSGLKVGDSVNCGDVIGTIAQANGMEMKQGAHLHLEISVDGKNADPDVYLDIVEK